MIGKEYYPDPDMKSKEATDFGFRTSLPEEESKVLDPISYSGGMTFSWAASNIGPHCPNFEF